MSVGLRSHTINIADLGSYELARRDGMPFSAHLGATVVPELHSTADAGFSRVREVE